MSRRVHAQTESAATTSVRAGAVDDRKLCGSDELARSSCTPSFV